MEPARSVHAQDHMKNSRKRKGRREEALKVVYISSPVKVKTSASRFRALVQELTGQDSDVSRYAEANNGSYYYHDHPQQVVADRGANSVSDRASDSTTSSDSYLEPSFDDLLMNSNAQGGFLGMFPSSNLICDQGFEFNGVLGEYGTAV